MAQTQMSFVFLTDKHVYKVKKPVNLGYLDYTTLEKRRFFCHQEVELNRRLCPDVYLEVVTITQDDGNIVVNGKGKVIDYAVKMRRLPQTKMMNLLLAEDQVSPEMVTGLAQKLAEFHHNAQTNDAISAFGKIESITQNTEENFTQTAKYIGVTISPEKYQHIKDYTNRFIERNAALFEQRVAVGRIRDCHGDLHAAHICFANGICIYDCIEFNDRFRYCDVASEIAFLAMDLDHYGRADLSGHFVNSYVDSSQDRELKGLLKFYKCYRAYVRGKVESFKLDDPYISESEKRQTKSIAIGYFDLAHSYTRPKPILLVTVGLVGTGKSTVAQALAKRLGLVVISSDVTRKQLASVPLTEHHFDEFDTGLYSADLTRLTYDKMFAEAEPMLAEAAPVIIDASFIRREERLKAKELANRTNADFILIECTLDEDEVKRRLAARLERGAVSDGRWEIFDAQKQRFQAVVEVPPANHIMIDTSRPLDELISEIELQIS